VPRLAQKTNTKKCILFYEEAIIFGGIFGCLQGYIKFFIPIPAFFVVIISFCIGIFYGCLAVSLAEVLDVIPILSRRTNLRNGMFFFILAIALGKLLGSLLYYVIPGFFKMS
jgi:stage V sporulation protein AB